MSDISGTLAQAQPVRDRHRPAVYDLVVIIVNWNVQDLLRECLRSLRAACEGLTVHIVVVDNASTDGSATMVAAEFPEIDLIRNSENLGFARANNQGLRRYELTARYQLLLNPDTVVAPDTFQTMLRYMDEHPEVGIAGCKLIKADGSLDYACKRSYVTPDVLFYKALGLDRRFPESSRFGRYQLTYLDPDQIHEVDSVVGAFLMIRRECLRQIGLLDEALFMYGEDCEWCYRAKEHEWKVRYVPITTVIHYKGQSTSKCSSRMIRHWYSATWYLYRKHLARRYNALVNAAVWLGCRTMCIASLLANALRRERFVPGRR